ncbi:MAG: type II toxin-antitoxin system prevent-host-death family antitoxin [Alphaproteobacteria bacterium]|nr:type II toxin-antitoxin system prevent-host-death family antitoxin [Alphaproteobacteria bacterium]
MVTTVNIAEAKAKLSALIEAAERGEEIILARAGKPVARITKFAPDAPKRRPGILKEMGWVSEPTPYEAFEPDPADAAWIDEPLEPPEVKR